jgi:ABC-type branched-subunit amino acid transport system substrate-binding protein
VVFETYPTGTSDYSAILKKVQDAAPDLLIAAAVRLDDHVAIIRERRGMNLDTKMVSSLPYGLLPEFYQQLGKDAEFVYSATFWEASLPNPGNREFVAAYQKEFNRAPAVQSVKHLTDCDIGRIPQQMLLMPHLMPLLIGRLTRVAAARSRGSLSFFDRAYGNHVGEVLCS